MKRRVIRPYKILAVALGAGAAACQTPARSDPTSTTNPAPTPSASAFASASASASASAFAFASQGAHAPPPDEKVDPKLLTLRAELDQATPETVASKPDHFRPLCDTDGYPLLGNLNRKGPGPPGASPSAFCASVRSKKPA